MCHAAINLDDLSWSSAIEMAFIMPHDQKKEPWSRFGSELPHSSAKNENGGVSLMNFDMDRFGKQLGPLRSIFRIVCWASSLKKVHSWNTLSEIIVLVWCPITVEIVQLSMDCKVVEKAPQLEHEAWPSILGGAKSRNLTILEDVSHRPAEKIRRNIGPTWRARDLYTMPLRHVGKALGEVWEGLVFHWTCAKTPHPGTWWL